MVFEDKEFHILFKWQVNVGHYEADYKKSLKNVPAGTGAREGN